MCFHQLMFMVAARDCILNMVDGKRAGGFGWPQEPSGYIGKGGRPQASAHAPYENYAAVVVIFEYRWIHLINSSKGREHVAILDKEILQNRKFQQLSSEASSVIIYLVKRRQQGYTDWLRMRKFRSKNETPSVSFRKPKN